MDGEDIVRDFLARWLLEWGDSEVDSRMLYAKDSWYAPHDVPSYQDPQFEGMFEGTKPVGRSYAVRITKAGLNYLKGEAHHVGNIEQLSNNT